jgi:hypothetical protein
MQIQLLLLLATVILNLSLATSQRFSFHQPHISELTCRYVIRDASATWLDDVDHFIHEPRENYTHYKDCFFVHQ